MNVGDRIMSQRVYHDLPVGSQVRGTYTWTKTGENEWSRPSGSSTVSRDNETLNCTGRVTIVTVGSGVVQVEVPTPGTQLTTYAEWASLPVGAIVVSRGREEDNRYHYRRISDPSGLMWENVSTGQHYENNQLANQISGEYILTTIPKEVAVPAYETPDKFMWLFYDVVARAAEEHGVPQATVTDAIKAIGHPVPDPAPGAEVRWNVIRDRLPQGTIVYCGYPESPVRFGVFKRSRNGWQHVFGPTQRMDNVVHVDYMPGVDESWALDPGSEETAREAAMLRAKAWQVGIKVKHAHGWCGELEGILHRAGLSENSINAARDFSIRVGSTVTVEEAAPLPAGSIFRWVDGDNYCYYKRVDDRTRNISRTRRVFGFRVDGGALRHYAASMEVIHLGDEPMNLGILIDQSKFSMIPPGSAWHFNGDQMSGPAYIMGYDGKCAAYQNSIPMTSPWDLRDLVGSQRETMFTFTNLEATS